MSFTIFFCYSIEFNWLSWIMATNIGELENWDIFNNKVSFSTDISRYNSDNSFRNCSQFLLISQYTIDPSMKWVLWGENIKIIWKKLRSVSSKKWRKIPILINGKNYFISFEFDWHVWNEKEMLRDKQHKTQQSKSSELRVSKRRTQTRKE